jgi:hypothetical protein
VGAQGPPGSRTASSRAHVRTREDLPASIGEAVRFSQEFRQSWSRVAQRGSETASRAGGPFHPALSSVSTTTLWSRRTELTV